MIRDKNNIPLEVGDVIKIFHFQAAYKGKKIYMYKVIREKSGILYADDLTDICDGKEPHSCTVDYIDNGCNYEIIDGKDFYINEKIYYWWERKQKGYEVQTQESG